MSYRIVEHGDRSFVIEIGTGVSLAEAKLGAIANQEDAIVYKEQDGFLEEAAYLRKHLDWLRNDGVLCVNESDLTVWLDAVMDSMGADKFDADVYGMHKQ